MDWKIWLAYLTGAVDQALLLRNAYLVTEKQILRNQLKGRLRLSDGECAALAAIGQQLNQKAREEMAHIATPDTILGWHRKLIAPKCDGSTQRKAPGRPKIAQELEALVVRNCARGLWPGRSRESASSRTRGGSKQGAPGPVASGLVGIASTQRLPCPQRSDARATSLPRHPP